MGCRIQSPNPLHKVLLYTAFQMRKLRHREATHSWKGVKLEVRIKNQPRFLSDQRARPCPSVTSSTTWRFNSLLGDTGWVTGLVVAGQGASPPQTHLDLSQPGDLLVLSGLDPSHACLTTVPCWVLVTPPLVSRPPAVFLSNCSPPSWSQDGSRTCQPGLCPGCSSGWLMDHGLLLTRPQFPHLHRGPRQLSIHPSKDF